jgi:hypothetical protein
MSKVAILYAPNSYTHASEAIRAAVVNGCGPGGWKFDLVPDTIYGLNITLACNIHDWMYHEGETIADKDTADRVMLNNLLRMIDVARAPFWLRKLRCWRARTYYNAVHLYGGSAFWADKNNGNETITTQVRQWPDHEQ